MATLGNDARNTGDRQGEDIHLRAFLPAYATAITLGQDTKQRFPELVKHLMVCAECQEQLNQLLQLIDPIFAATLEPITRQRALDLSFLESAVVTPVSVIGHLQLSLDSQLERLRRQIITGQRQPTAVGFRSAAQARIEYEPDPATTGGVGVLIELFASDSPPNSCDLALTVVLPRGVQAPNGIAATLLVDQQRYTITIDDADQYVFEGNIPLDATSLSIVTTIVP